MKIAERVAKGVMLLDEKQPDWRDSVDVERFNIHCIFSCLLTQVFGSWGEGKHELSLRDGRHAAEYGFELAELGFSREDVELNDEWIKRITN